MDTLLAEQANVLTQIDELNARIENVLKEMLPARAELGEGETVPYRPAANAPELEPVAAELKSEAESGSGDSQPRVARRKVNRAA
jgi:hypothetical protein